MAPALQIDATGIFVLEQASVDDAVTGSPREVGAPVSAECDGHCLDRKNKDCQCIHAKGMAWHKIRAQKKAGLTIPAAR